MSEPTMSWNKMIEDCASKGLLAKQLYAVDTIPTKGLGPVLAMLDDHIVYQVHLERSGVMWTAGPFANDTDDAWDGEGFFVNRAESRADAIKLAEADPMHSSGARKFRVRTWLLNEGSFQVRIDYSIGKAS